MIPRILIVDDEPNVRLGYRMTLESDGFAVGEADSATEAMEAFSIGRFDAAILDMRMPDRNGIELLEEMRKHRIMVPVTFVTAYGDVPNAVRAMKLGAIDFLEKPLTPNQLRSVVRDILRRNPLNHESEKASTPASLTHLITAKRLINLQDFPGAREHLTLAAHDSKLAPDAFNLLGVIYEMEGDYEKARTYYGHSIRLQSDFEPAQQNMRRIFDLFHFGTSPEPYHFGTE